MAEGVRSGGSSSHSGLGNRNGAGGGGIEAGLHLPKAKPYLTAPQSPQAASPGREQAFRAGACG